MMDSGKKELIMYKTPDGKVPYEKWFSRLSDPRARYIIRVKLDRLERYGHAGKCESVGDGVYELKIYCGPGYRVYFGEKDQIFIILLCGGDKSSQERDIQTAREYWAEYKRRV